MSRLLPLPVLFATVLSLGATCAWGGEAGAQTSEADLRAELDERRSTQKAEDEAAASRAYARIGGWNLRVSTRKKIDFDIAVAAEVLKRFDVIALQDPGDMDDLQAMLGMLRATSGRDWRAVTPSRAQANPTILWDAGRAQYVRHRSYEPPLDRLTSPLLVVEMRWQDRPFYMAGVEVFREGLSPALNNQDYTKAFLTQSLAGFTPDKPPLFLAISTTGEVHPEAMTWLHGIASPILRTGQVTVLPSNRPRPDNVLTSYRRPVRTGPYPYHEALILEPRTAHARVSARMPIIVLATLAE